ncbi:MAG: divergent polysaccharide deacetylase family protein [Phascolarctobacterium sp.]|nr:divergent polysaccharide deacetylase family protein [Candidatus Phascolarctobacterium caballi]
MAKAKRKRVKPWGCIMFIVFLAIISMVGGFLYTVFFGSKDILNPPVSNGQKQTISFIDESIEAQRTLDEILLKQTGWQLVEKAHGNKEVKISETGAAIQLNERYIGVGVPETMTPAAAGAWLKKKVANAGLVYIDGYEELYNGKYDGYKCQVGIALKAGKGKRNFTVDTVHFFNNLNLTRKQETKPVVQRHFDGKLAIVIDDCGTDIKQVRALLNLDVPFTFSILPNKDFSSDILSAVNTKGRVALLHLPMEPLNRSAMSEGANTITSDMTPQQMSEMTLKHLKGLYGVVGVNNHQGSKVTADAGQMKTILSVLKSENMFFLDSRTNSQTVARDVAREMGVKTCMNDKFLDNSTDVDTIRDEVYKVMEMAEQNGSAIAICHARPHTVAMWKKYLNEFKATGITFVPVTDLLY